MNEEIPPIETKFLGYNRILSSKKSKNFSEPGSFSPDYFRHVLEYNDPIRKCSAISSECIDTNNSDSSSSLAEHSDWTTRSNNENDATVSIISDSYESEAESKSSEENDSEEATRKDSTSSNRSILKSASTVSSVDRTTIDSPRKSVQFDSSLNSSSDTICVISGDEAN